MNSGQINMNLSIGHLNIEGLHHSTLGCKLDGQVDLLNDIEILSETWSKCQTCRNMQIQNYILLKSIEPLKKGVAKNSCLRHIFSATGIRILFGRNVG